MLESLLTPRPRPAWQVTFWNGVAIAGVLFFLATTSVAFLREAKAVRVARQALEANQNTRARKILTRFLGEHPKHREALFLDSQAAVRLGDLAECAELRSRLQRLDQDRLAELDPAIGIVLDAAIVQKGCYAQAVLGYYDQAGVFGDAFKARLLTDVQQAVRRCQATEGEQDAAYEMVVGMVKRGVGASMVEETYLTPLRQDLADGRFQEAGSLALGASRISTETDKTVQGLLADVRAKVDSSVQSVKRASERIAADPRNRVGRFWCFPETAPAAARVADAWGHSLQYQPRELDETLHCYQGFDLKSKGADGRDGPEGDRTPAGDIDCRVDRGRRTCEVPDGFWQTGDS